MERPLKKSVGDDLGWTMNIEEMSHSAGFDYPVFIWSFDGPDGWTGGVLRAWAPQGIIVFTGRGQVLIFDSLEAVLKEIEPYGWGEPLHIDEVFQDVMETRKKIPAPNKEEAVRIFEELRKKWTSLIVSG